MTKSRSKSDPLSQTSKTFAKEWMKENIYGYRKEIQSKYLEKGTVLEDIAIDKAIEWLDLPFVIKNEKSFEDEFFTGTPDLILENEVIDIKCSYDCFTFPLFEEELPTDDYYYQLQVYMHLTGKKKGRVVYVLLNTPEEIAPWEEEKDYDDLDKKYRVKSYEFDFDEKVIEDLKEKVLLTREYLKEITKWIQ